MFRSIGKKLGSSITHSLGDGARTLRPQLSMSCSNHGRMIMPKPVLYPTLNLLLLLLAASASWVWCSPGDITCLQQIKDSVEDPDGYLDNWQLSDPQFDHCVNGTFGVTCMHGEIYTLILANASLAGPFPRGLGACKSLTEIDFSNNELSGPIPPTLCTDVPYLVTINLANNKFDGPVPEDLALCYYVNYIYLEVNDFCGLVPDNINNKTLTRLKKFEFYGNNVGVDCVSKSKSATALIVGIALGGVAVVFVVGFVSVVYWWLFSRPATTKGACHNDWIKCIKAPNRVVVSMVDQPLVRIKLSDLMEATEDFTAGKVISSLRSGTVYKGTLKDGSVMAIKRLEVTDRTNQEFRAEMETLGKLRHRNLVPLLGYCIAGKERLLVYKHMPGGSLHDLLRSVSVSAASLDADVEYGLEPRSAEMVESFPLDWVARLSLAIGIARGLAWLHHSCHPRVLHRSISPGSILLDEDLEPKISNFGLARLMSAVDTHVSTVINRDLGDVGYVAPEYARTLVATKEGDVYSFGVVLLELVTGRNAADVKKEKFRGTLVSWVWMLHNSGKASEAVDKTLIDGVRDDELIQFLKLAISCTHPTPRERPSSYEVFHMLRQIGEKYQLSDENDEIPLTERNGEELKYELIVSTKNVSG